MKLALLQRSTFSEAKTQIVDIDLQTSQAFAHFGITIVREKTSLRVHYCDGGREKSINSLVPYTPFCGHIRRDVIDPKFFGITDNHQGLPNLTVGELYRMSYRVDHKEPIPKLIKRLEGEHHELALKLDHVLELADTGNLQVAESTLLSLSQQILRHAVEEEARIIQVIADKAKPELERSAEIMRHHRRIEEFLKDKLPHLPELPQSKAKLEIKDFVAELKKHQKEEEETLFPLALRISK